LAEQLRTPFTDAQVASLNAYQEWGTGHPFTWGTDVCRGILRATRDGWGCPICGCRQEWAWSWMADWSWQRPHPVQSQEAPNSSLGSTAHMDEEWTDLVKK
jgi:hypothetical protein